MPVEVKENLTSNHTSFPQKFFSFFFCSINQFQVNVLFLYSLQTLESYRFFYVFRGYRKEY